MTKEQAIERLKKLDYLLDDVYSFPLFVSEIYAKRKRQTNRFNGKSYSNK